MNKFCFSQLALRLEVHIGIPLQTCMSFTVFFARALQNLVNVYRALFMIFAFFQEFIAQNLLVKEVVTLWNFDCSQIHMRVGQVAAHVESPVEMQARLYLVNFFLGELWYYADMR